MKNKYIYIIALLLTVLICLSVEIQHQTATKQISTLTAQNITLQQDIAALQTMADIQAQDIEQLTKEIAQLKAQQTKPPEAQKINRGGDRLTSLGEYTVTAYCSCEICCGKYAKNRPGGKVYGAAGVELIPGVSVAGWLPLGTRIMIDGHEYIVQDRTAKWVKEKYDGRIIDIYFDDHEAAWNWGKRQKEIFTLEEGRS